MSIALRATFLSAAALGAAVPASAAPLPRPPSFAMCGVCHKTAAGEPNTIGPNLWQVSGRKAGTAAGYAYSPAMKGSGITWNKASLTTYLADPKKVVPGTKMAYAGQKDPKQLAALVDYVLSLK